MPRTNPDSCNRAFVALGSNLGDSSHVILQAIEQLSSLSTAPLVRSSLWETSPVECPPGSPLFINAVVAIAPSTTLTAEDLLLKLQALEREFGRQPKTIHNEARPLDLDLIAFGSRTLNLPNLVLPHPRAHVRRFVLEPLSEIAPDLVLPGQTQTVKELLNALGSSETLKRLE